MKDIKYIILPPCRTPSKELLEIYQNLYSSWKSTWIEVFAKVGKEDEINLDDFYKQNLIVALLDNNRPMAMHMYSFYDLELQACRQQSYFNDLPEEALDFFRKNEISKVMTMEYLTVFPEYRKHNSGISWAEVLIVLGTKLLHQTPCQYAIGTARTDVKVHKMGLNCNWKTSTIEISKYDYNCEIMYFKKNWNTDHPSPQYRNIIDSLWENRTDHTNYLDSELKSNKNLIAA